MWTPEAADKMRFGPIPGMARLPGNLTGIAHDHCLKAVDSHVHVFAGAGIEPTSAFWLTIRIQSGRIVRHALSLRPNPVV